MLEIYTIYGGGMWKTALDAVVTLVGQNTFHTLMRIAGTFGVLAVLLTFIKQRNRRWRCRCMTTTAGVRAWPWFPWLPARKGG
ncbi:TPA: hypothetical protein ORM73_004399 [Enterobacter kobei]|nr:hypothetical protein [Enterobacter kobei]